MPEPSTPAPVLRILRDLLAWFRSGRTPGVVIGGVAASLLGRPRMTRDVDALVLLPEARWEGFLAAGKRFGFTPRRQDPIPFARKTRTLLVRHGRSGIDADIVFGEIRFEREMIERAVRVDAGGVRVPLPTPEDLVIMKAVANRPRDLADIESIVEIQRKMDLRRVRRWVRRFAEALEMPGIIEDLEALLAGLRERGR